MAFYLGIDAGGTSTRCVVGDEHKVLGNATTSTAKIARVGNERAREALQAAIREACSAAEIRTEKISHACIGISGASRAEVSESARAWAGEILRATIEVVGDMVVAHEAAFWGGPGVLVIAGTGSIGFARDHRGKTGRTGGGGAGISDEGSGDWIGRRAVQAALRDGGQSALLKAIAQAWGVQGHDLQQRTESEPPPDFAALFPTVLNAAASGNDDASEILHGAGKELAKLASVLIHQLWPQPQRVPVAFAGGVFENSATVRDTFVTQLRADLKPAGYEIAVSFGLAEPVMGALSLARRAALASAART